MNKNITYAGIIIALIAAIFAVSHTAGIERANTPVTSAATTTVATTTAKMPAQPATTPSAIPRVTASTSIATSSMQSPADNVTLTAEGKIYGAYITGNESALELMQTLASTTDFTFTGEEYPSLGFFVESISGKKSADGYYWILYVNGKSSDVGASNATIRPGAAVEWRYGKSY